MPSEHSGPNKMQCKKCGRTCVPTRAGNCFYCGKGMLDEPGHAEPRQLGGQARFVPQADERRHYIVLETGGHVEMSVGQLFVIGRDPHASLVVNSPDVSRQHCEVDWEGDAKRPVLCEVRSRNGTYLNERIVVRGQREPLRSGDTVRLGPGSVLRYFFVSVRDFENLQKENGAAQTGEFRAFVPTDEDRALATSGAAARGTSGRIQHAPPPPGGAMDAPAAASGGAARVDEAMRLQGRLKDVAPAQLLKWLHDQRYTGTLTFFDGNERGEAHLEEGRCVYATFGALTGREVIEKFVTLQEGGYRFRKASDRQEKEPLPFPVRGKLSERSALDLVMMIEQNGLSGELTITDGPDVSAQAVFVDGVWTEARFGEIAGKMAKHMVSGLRHGEYRFREAGVAREASAETNSVVDALVSGPASVDEDDGPLEGAGALDPTTTAGPATASMRSMIARDPAPATTRDTRDTREPPPPRPAPRTATAQVPKPPAPTAPMVAETPQRAAPPPLRVARGGPASAPAARQPTPGTSGRQPAAVPPDRPPTTERPAASLPRDERPTQPVRPPRPSTREVVRPSAAELDDPPTGASPRPSAPPLKEPPLRDERPIPEGPQRPPLRTSESARNRRQSPPPLPPPRSD